MTQIFQGSYAGGDGSKIKVKTTVIEFWQGKTLVLYSPQLEVYGYGADNKEAHLSFETCISEFIRYTINKGTFIKELKRLGWIVKGKKKYSAPSFSSMLRDNDKLIDIMDSQDARIHQHDVSLPALL